MIIATFSVIIAILTVNFDLEKKIRTKLNSLGLAPYKKTMIIGLLAISIVSLLFVYPFVFIKHNWPGLFGFWVCMSYPLVLMSFRHDIFDEKMNKTFPRYLIYYVFSLTAGALMTVRGFSMLNFPEIPSELAFTVIILSLIGQSIPLFPDYIEKVVPIKLGIKKGIGHLNANQRKKTGIFMAILSVGIFLTIRFIAMIIQSQIFGIPN